MKKELRYTNPNAAGYLLEAEGCEKVVKELRRLVEKYQRKIDREQATRRAELEAAMEYKSERDIQEAYGWELITERQYERYLDLFRQGQSALEEHTPNSTELALRIIRRILSDIALEQREWEFSALSPQEQLAENLRAEQAKNEWKRKVAEIKAQMGEVSADTEDALAESKVVG